MSWVDLLPEPRTRRFRETLRLCKEREAKYPFAAKTDGTGLKPQTVEEQLGVYFLRVPFPASGFTVWAFETEENRAKFLREFRGSNYEDN